MKARNKITGKEITILGISKEYGTVSYIADGVLYQENFASGALEIIDDSDPSAPVDWSSFRREAARDFISGMLANVSPAANQWTTPEIVSAAIEIADELIKQLKQE